MPDFIIDENARILVEFEPPTGLQKTTLAPADILERSTKALDSAMNTIHHMARRVTTTVESLDKRPSQVEVSFGLKLDTEVGALIAKVGGEASVNVSLTWNQKET